jgi:hypothetical protein
MTHETHMSLRETRIRSLLLTYFPMLIAVLSLCTSIFNGYLNSKFLDIIQHNVGRVEQMRTCKEIIDAYFQVKFRAGVIRANGAKVSEQADQEGANAVSRFAALGTYLANLRDEATRVRYTELSRMLERIVREAGQSTGDLNVLFEPADRLFAQMNSDCVNSAKDGSL